LTSTPKNKEKQMTDTKNFFCSDLAWEYGIPLLGTATRGDVWLLLEYTERWGSKAFEESSLPQEVKNHISAALRSGVEVRTLLIKQDQSRYREGYRFFVGHTHPIEPRLYEYHLQSYTDLLKIDLDPLVVGQPGDPTHQRSEPLYLVCTNGKRDQCCSLYGPETYQAMTDEAGDAVWQSSHIGGHNQAPIMLFFPHGVNYGHSTPSEVRRLIQAYQQGKLVLSHYRGRVCFEQPVQAAEHFWREQTGILDLLGIQIQSITQSGENEWKINISDPEGEKPIQMRIQRSVSEYEVPITCSKKKTAPVTSFHRIYSDR
jgi:hypothetical protein